MSVCSLYRQQESHNSELEARDDIAMMTETLTDRYKARLLARCS
jgi:hypothetical protein